MRNLKSTIRRKSLSALLVLLSFVVSIQAQNIPARQKPSAKSSKDYLNLLKESSSTIAFIENKGQFAPEVRMVGSTNVGNMWVLNNQIYFQSLHKEKDEAAENANRSASEIGEEEEGKTEAHNWGIFMEGMNPEFTVSKELEMPTKRSYFLGNDKKYWASDVASYGEISLDNIYKGVDLRLYSQDKRHLEFDWLVEPGADYSQIKMRFKGQEALRVDEKGNLDVQLEFDHVKFDIPEAYQIVDGKKVAVQISFVVKNNVATFSSKEKIDNRYALVIDPSLKWGTWFDNGTNLFDQYLYAVDIDGSGNVYCGGTTNSSFSRGYTGTNTVYGFDSTYNDAVNGGTANANNGYSDGIVYKISANGTTLMNITYFGATSPASGTRTTFDEVYGLSLSPDFSTVYICGRTGNTGTNNLDIPLVNAWDNSRNGTTREGYVAKFNSSLTSLQYSTYIGGAGTTDDAMYSIHALSNTSFVVGGDVDGAVQTSTPNYIVNAYDATYSGGDEMYIAKFSPDNTLVFGTYIGGQNDDHLNDINPFNDGAICFSGRTNSSLASFPGGATGINRASSNGGDNNQDGVVGVIPSNGGTFTMLSRIGGSGNDEFNGLAIDPFDTIYVSGTTSNNNFPLGAGATAANRLDNSYNGGTDGIIAKIPRSGFTGGTDPWAATYFGGSGTDIANTLRLYTPYAICSFGTTTSAAGTIANNGFPVQNLADGGTFYQASLVAGIDMYWLVLGTDLKTQYFTTYAGGSGNDYLGATGVPRGSNQFVTEGDSLIILGTTSHSSNTNPGNTGFSPTILGPTTGPLKSFQPYTTDLDGDDKHIIFKWRMGVLLNFDYGDAPSTLGYGSPNHIVFQSLKIGSLLDKEDLPQYSYKADGDDNLTSDDEDGITTPTVTIQDTSTRFSKVINVTNNTGVTAILAGWIDFNKSGGFGDVANEVDTVLVPPGATTVTLTWSGYNASAAYFNMPNDTTYMRLRLTTQSNFFVTNPSPTLNAANGEIEDYLVIRYHCVNLTSALIDTNTTTSCGFATGSIVITNDTIYAGVQYGVYYSKDGGPLQGPFFYTTTGSGISGTLTISGLSAGTYTALQVFHPTNPDCGFTLPSSYTIVDPTPPLPPTLNTTASALCAGGSFTLSVPTVAGATFTWSGPNGFSQVNTATTSFTFNSATTAMSGLYSVTEKLNNCGSTPATVTVTVNANPIITASTTTPVVCAGDSIHLTSSPSSGTPGYSFSWSGPSGYSATAQNPGRLNVTTAMAGVYTVTVTDSKTCTATASTTSITVNQTPSITAGTTTPEVCSGDAINLTSTPSGGTPAYTYVWSGPSGYNANTQNPGRLNVTTAMAGVYNVTLTDSKGCTATASTSNITVNAKPTVTAGTTTSTVCAGDSIHLTSTPSGGTPGYTYLWSGPASYSATAQNPVRLNVTTAMGGIYNLTLTDSKGCTATASTSSITVNPTPSVSAGTTTPTVCAGDSIHLTSTPSGGTPGYTYIWSGTVGYSATSQNPGRLNVTTAMAGSYSVTLTDSRSCSATAATSNIVVNPTPSITASSSSPVYCSGDNINLTSLPTGGTPGYTYSWSGPLSFSPGNVQNPTRANATTGMSGVYTVLVTDSKGCSATASTGTITVNPSLSVTSGSNTPVCAGGTINLTSSTLSGTAPYSYSWSGPNTFSSGFQNPSINGAAAVNQGTYNITITDSKGCSGTGSTNVTVNPTATVTVTSNSEVCEGATITLNANLSGGTSPFGYQWSGPVGFAPGDVANPSRLAALLTYQGTYSVTVTDANGCSGTGTTFVTVNPTPTLSAGSNTPVCYGTNINLTSTPTGGTLGFSYSWTGPAGFAPGNTQNPIRSGATTLMSGTYNVTVTDANSCSASATTAVTVNPQLTASSTSTQAICAGNSANLGGSPTAAGGTSPYSYAWSNGAASTSNPTVSPSITTVYVLTVTDFIGCTATASSTVNVNQTPTANAGPDKTMPICTTIGISIGGSPTATGGTGPYGYVWSPSTGLSSTGASNPLVLGITTDKTYNLTVTDANGCSAIDQVVVNVTPNSLSSNITASGAVEWCAGSGSSVTLTDNVSGGTTPYAYVWSGTNITPTNAAATLANPSTAATYNYSVVATDSFGCTVQAAISVKVDPTPTANAGSTQTICDGKNAVLGGSPTANGGTSPYNYAWSGGAASTSNPSVSPSITTVFNLTVTDFFGCSASASATVNVNSTPTANAGPDKSMPVCTTIGISIGGSPTALGGTAPYGYVWSPSTGLSSTGASNPLVLGITTAQTYNLTVTDANGCSSTDQVIVNVTPNSLNSNISASGAVEWCAGSGESVTLTDNVSGGTTPYTYSWSGTNISPTNAASTLSNPNTAATYNYSVVATDSFGCTIQSSTSVKVNSLPTATAGGNQSICQGLIVTLGGNPTASGGTSPYSYSWSGGFGNNSNPIFVAGSNASYTLTVTDSKGCSATSSATVAVNANPSAHAGTDKIIPSCAVSGPTLGTLTTGTGGTAPLSYLWTPASALSSDTSANPQINALGSSTTFTVVVTDANGCTASDQVDANVTGSSLNITIIPNTSLFWCEGSGGQVTFSALPSGGTGPYSIRWVGVNMSVDTGYYTTVNPNPVGIYLYSAILTDATGCQAGNSIPVQVFPHVNANAGLLFDTICNGQTVTLGGNPTASGGTLPYTYAWSGGTSANSVSNPTANPSFTTAYTVVVTDSNSCSASAISNIAVRSNPIVNAGTDVTQPSCSPTGVQIGGSPTASGGTPGYTYTWTPSGSLSSTSVSNPIVQGLLADQTYTVVVSDVNGCSASDQVLVSVSNNSPVASISSSGSVEWCSGSGTSVNLTANITGGNAPFNYNWSGTNINPTNAQVAAVNPNTSGTYTYNVTVTDAFNCTTTATKTIIVDALPSASGGSNHAICNGESVAIGGSPTASGGNAPYTYAWSGGASPVANPTVSPLTTTTYTVTVTDNKGCIATASTTVTVRSKPVANAGTDVTQPSCSPTGVQIGGSPTASGGTPGYTYTWTPSGSLSSTSVSNPIVQGLLADQTYTVVVTDANGCSSSDQVLVHITNASPTVSITSSGPSHWCSGSGTSVNLSANLSGGSLPFGYQWTGTSINPTNSSVVTVNPTLVGTYTYSVTVSDGYNCTTSATTTITVDALPSANAGSSHTICNGETVTLGGSPTGNAGLSPYTYSWSGGAAPSANPSVTPSTSTTYLVVVTDQNGCSASSSSTVTVRPRPIADAGADKTLPGCSPSGIQIGGSPTANGGGGGPYTYVWAPSNGLSDVSLANPIVQGLVADVTYTVVVTDANGCSSSDQVLVQVTNNSPVANISSSGTTSWCANLNNSVNLTANVTGGNGPFSYTWSGSNINPTNTQVVSAHPIGKGVYTYVVTITDGYNCTATATTVVTIDSVPTASAGGIEGFTICSGASVVIGGSPTASGGTGPYTYSWSGGAGLVSNPTVNPGTTTTYIVTVTDNNGCSSTGNTIVNVRPIPSANAGNDKSATSCSGSCVQIGGSPTGFGGSGALTYTWTPTTGLNDAAIANPIACNLANNTIYTVVVTDALGCSATDVMGVTIVNSTLTAEAGAGGAFCFASGDSVMLGGFPTAVGGTPPYTYTWAPAGLNLTNPANPWAFPTITTKYNLTLTDALGCTSIDSTTVRVYPKLYANAGNDTAICFGFAAQLGSNPTAIAGSGNVFTYAWSPTTGVSNIAVSNPTVIPATTTSYVVTVVDGNGCQASDTVKIVVRPNPTAQAGLDKNLYLCPGDSVVIGENPSAIGGTGVYTYSWSPASGLNSTTIANPVVKGLNASQTYTLLVTDANGCSSTDIMAVNLLPNGLQLNAGNDKSICFGNSVQLGALPLVVGGTSPYLYTWIGGSLNDSTASNPVANPTTTTTYTVSVVDSKGCSAIDDVVVTVNPELIANAGPDTSVCAGGGIVIGGNTSASGGTPGYTYAWTPSLGLSSAGIANPTASPNVVTTYQLIVVDSKGCSSLDEVTVTPRTNPIAEAGNDKTLVGCAGDSTFIGGLPTVVGGGTPPYSCVWSPSLGLSDSNTCNPTVQGLSVGSQSYQLIVKDVYGCTGVDYMIVNVTPSTLQVDAGNNGSICSNAIGAITIGGNPTAVGGTAPYSFTWSSSLGGFTSSLTNPQVSPTVTTTYYVTVSDSKGCVSTDSVGITVNVAPIANAENDTTICSGFCVLLGSANTAASGSSPYQYSWTPTLGLNANNTANPLACPIITTTYSVIVTDAKGCQNTENITVTIRPLPSAFAGSDQNLTTCGGDSVQIGGSPAANGGVSPFSYAWSPSNGLSGTTIANPYVKGIVSSHVYTLTVTDVNGCTAEDGVSITIVPTTLAADAGNDATYCSGAGATAILGAGNTGLGGTPSYTFTWTSNPSGFGSTVAHPIVSPNVTTIYTVTVGDAKGCVAVDSVTITVNASPVANAGRDTTLCKGKTVILGGQGTASGNFGPFTYNWSPSTGLSSVSASNPIATAISSVSYSVIVTDANGCTANDVVQINVNDNPVSDAGLDKSLVACASDSVKLGGSPSASGGGGVYTYNWSPAPQLNNSAVANPFASHLGSTTNFTLVVTDQFGCSAQDQVSVNVNQPTFIVNAGNDVSFCEGTSVSVTLGSPAVGGTLPYTYSWTPGSSLNDSTRYNPIASPTVTTTYTVAVKDAAGCFASDTVKITINPRPVVNAGVSDTICAGECLSLGGSPTASSGTGSIAYLWAPSQFINGSVTSSNPIACPTATITYQVTATDSLGCSNNASIFIRVNQNPVAFAGTDKSLVDCNNSCITIGGSPSANGGGGGYLYAWSPTTGLNNTGLANPSVCNLAQGVNYTLTVTDANGCTAVDQVNVTLIASTLHADAGVDKSICVNPLVSNCIAIGGANAVTGASGSYVIDWSPVNGICNFNNIPNPEVSPTTTTTYTLSVTDSLGCVAIDSVIVFANPPVTVTVGNDTDICAGGSAVLGGSPTGSAGTGNITYTWNPGTGLSNSTVANPVATPTASTSYCVTVTDAVGCSSSTCQSITVNQAILANAGLDQSMTNCPGAFVVIGGSPAGTGGSNNYTYSWSPAVIDGVTVLNGTSIPNPVVTGLTHDTVFTLTVTDFITGCSGTDQVKITVNQTTLAVDAGLDRTLCANSGSCVSIGGNPTAVGGVSPYIYQWSPITGLNSGNVANPCAAPATTTTYRVTVTDQVGCSFVDSVKVIVSPLITVNAGNDIAICFGTSTTLGASPAAAGGTGVFTYLWSPAIAISSTVISNPTANPTTNSSYTLTVRDSLGCSASDIINISIRALPIANAGPNAAITACSGDSAILGGTPTATGTVAPYTYLWSPPTALSSVTVANPVVKQLGFITQFCVIVTDSFGCQASSCQTTTVLPNTVFVDAGTNISPLCSNVAGCVTLGGTVGGGYPQYTYQWYGTVSDPSVLHPQACPSATTTYLLVVTDTKGCQASDSVQVIVNQPVEASISGLNLQYCIGSGNVVMTGIPAGGTFSGPFVTGNVFQPTAIGNWCIKYSYTSPTTGCTDDTTICVTVNPLPVVSASGFNPGYCHFEAPFTITGTPAGGVFSGSSGISSSGVFTPTNATVGNNNITYTYTDPQTQCSNTFSFVINIKDAPTLNITSSVDTACAGQTVTLSANVSLDVFNVRWFHLNGSLFNSTLAPFGYIPTGFNDVVVAQAVNTPGNCYTYDTLTIHVNQPPVALNDSATTLEEVPVSISELVNDSDPEGNINSVTVLSVGHGTATLGNGVINYVSNTNYNGLDTIVYKLCNTNCPNACDTAIIAITVTPVNDPPVIADTTITINENDTAEVCPFVFDVDGDELVIGNAQCTPLNGTVVFTSDSCFEFIPTFGWTGTQVICVTVCDPSGLCDTARITIHVLPINHRPRTSRVSVTVCENTSIGINVAAGAADPEGSPLSFTYGNATKPNNNATYTLTSTGNGAVVFSADTAGNYVIPYIVCDNSNPSLCDTNRIIVTVVHCDSANVPPVANNDEVETCVSRNLIINELANDFDSDQDSLFVSQILSQPTLAGAVVSVNNTTGTLNYTSPTAGFDSILYIICDTQIACDTAVVYIKVSDTCVANHPPVAVDDFDSTDYITAITVHVLSNDHDPDGDAISIVSVPCPPSHGNAIITNGVVIYTPDSSFNATMTDTFCYVIRDSKGALDTAVVVIYVKNSVQGRADCGNNITGVDNPIDINVLANDFDPEGHTFSITTLISTPGITHGIVSLNENGTIHFVPDTTICGITDRFQYVIQDALGATDTVAVCVQIDCCRKPVANTDTATIIGGDSLTINVLSNDLNSSGSLTAVILVNAQHGNATITGGVLHYVPISTYCGFDTVQYVASGLCGVDTALLIVNVYCNQKPIAGDDNLTICINDTSSIDILLNDKDIDGNALTITGFGNPFPANLAAVTEVNGGSVSFQANGNKGTFTLNYYICDNGLPSKCDTGVITVKVVPCQVHIDTLYDTTYVNISDTICLGGFIQGPNNPSLTSLCSPTNGTVQILSGDSCFVYVPNLGFIGNDTFCIVVCDTLGNCDTSGVVITVLDKLIQAIDEPCDLDTAYINEPITLNVLANDILPWSSDTLVTLIGRAVNGSAIVNADNTVTYTPSKDYKGTENLSYIVCAVTGSNIFCDTAEICITVVDTTVECFTPNAFSPNGDGINDLYKIPCNSKYPKATIRIFDRWGVEVWFSEGSYMNDFAGNNMQGTPLPDSTYYMIYEYNDGSGKREAKFIVIGR